MLFSFLEGAGRKILTEMDGLLGVVILILVPEGCNGFD